MTYFAVITKTPTSDDGNRACSTMYINPRGEEVLFCSVPVFKLGEILVMDCSSDRTIPDGRKPSKWDVECETFNDIESAVKRAIEVVE